MASVNNGLPSGWAAATLEGLLTLLETGSRPKGGVKDIKSGVPSIGGEYLNSDGGFRFEKIRYVPRDFADSMSKGHLRLGDILVVKDGATTGKVSLVTDSFPHSRAVINEHVFLCRVFEGINPAYVFHLLFSTNGQEAIRSDFRGAAQGGISRAFAEKVTIPLAPSNEQTRIAAAIEEQFTRLDSGVAALKRVEANLKRYKAAVLKAAVEGRLTERWRAEHPDMEPASELLKRILKERRRKWEEAELGKMIPKGKAPINDSWRKKYREPAGPVTSDLPSLPETWTWATAEQLSDEMRAITYGVVNMAALVWLKRDDEVVRWKS